MNICADNITILTPEECDTIIQLANETGFGDARVVQPDTAVVDTEYRRCQTSFIKLKSIEWLKEKLFKTVYQTNSKHFKFVLHGIHDIQVIRYDIDSFYDKHLDVNTNESNQQRKLTFVIQLSDSNHYTGGDLILYADKKGRAVSRNKGSIAIFPSFTLHEVSKLTSGIRYSMIGWCFGPEFK